MHQAMQYTRLASWPLQCFLLRSQGTWMCVFVGVATSPCRRLAGRIVGAAFGNFQGLPWTNTACGGARYLSGTALRPHRPVKYVSEFVYALSLCFFQLSSRCKTP